MVTNKDSGVPSPDRDSVGQSPLIAIFLCAVVAPLLVWSVDFVVLSLDTASMGAQARGAVYFFFVVQVSVLGWLCGKFIPWEVIRWSVYLWLLVLINMVVVISKNSGVAGWPFDVTDGLAYGFVSGELGMLVVYSVLGPWKWYWRIPLLLVGVWLLTQYITWLDPTGVPRWSRQSGWGSVLFFQGLSAFLICLALRIPGFRISLVSGESTAQSPGDARPNEQDGVRTPPQFSIFHLLVWTTALAPLFAVVRVVDWSSLSSLSAILQPLELGVCLAFISLVAIWCGLGRENLFVRIAGSLVLVSVVGSGIGKVAGAGWLDSMWINRWLSNSGTVQMQFWLTWSILASSFLAAMLMFFRATGCRLIRRFEPDSVTGRVLSFLLPKRIAIQTADVPR